jgi:aerobic-type carbon monoxide dehydrogenase small subunit (CoxS/CutS family)/carbon monoxide dehydrogenase subunit G
MSTPREVARTAPGGMVTSRLTVNGIRAELTLAARVTLADALRDRLGLTGTHVGCEHGVCGMCTVLVDGAAVRSCLMLACQADGAEITTVEGLGSPGELHPLQESFGRHHALQCGFCTPAFLLSAYDLLEHDPEVRREDLPAELSGVICRCTGYRNIVEAVAAVADSYRPGEEGSPSLPPPLNCAPRLLPGPTSTLLSSRTHQSGSDTSAPSVPGADAAAGGHPDEITLPAGDPTAVVDLTREIPVPVPAVTAILADIQVLARCLPGAELTAELGDAWYQGRARVTVGPVRLSFTGIAQLAERGERHLRVLAQGSDPASGQAQADITLSVTEADSAACDRTGSVLAASARLYLTGRIASFGRSLSGDVAAYMFTEFVNAVERAATGRQPDAVRPVEGLRLVAAVLAKRLRAALVRVFGRRPDGLMAPHRAARGAASRGSRRRRYPWWPRSGAG